MSALGKAGYLVTPEEYLAGERISEAKHEYLAGVVYAMAGTTVQHSRIANNIVRELGNQLRGKKCEPFSSDVKVRIESGGVTFYYYPDVTVDCSEVGGESLFAEQPRVIFEVTSRETERVDRGEKLRNYQALSSLAAYVLVDQYRRFVTVYGRENEAWESEFLIASDAILPLPAISCELPLSVIYERTGL